VSTILANVTCVAIEGRAVLIEGAPGSGKSSLALALIDRGAVLVGDDGVTLDERDGRLRASPPPNIAGLLEVRNVGLVTLPTASAPLALAIRLDEAAPRHIDMAETAERAGHAIPTVALHPGSPVLALRAEFALKTHGLA
jgi:serine kinase of HPr protein (carbohydrate metabolism regulator)